MEEALIKSSTFEISLIAIIVLLSMVIVFAFVKMRKQKKALQKKQAPVEALDTKQDAMLENMSDNIYELTKNLVKSHEKEVTPIESAILNSANNLRELLKIKSGKVEIFYETFSLSHMLDDITASMYPHFKDSKSELIFQVEDNVPMSLTSDVVHLSRIINNILEFCILSTPEGIVKLNTWTSGKDKSILNIEITDNSEGMSSDALHDIFTLNLDDETGEHVGLALYIAKELSSQMGGRLEAKSKQGLGNSFFVAVPIEPSVETARGDKTFYKSIEKKKVLIYLEKSASAASLKTVLHPYYKDITIADASAMEKMKINLAEFDLIIFDAAYMDQTNAEYLSLIKKSKTVNVLTAKSVFSTAEPLPYTCIDAQISLPLTRVKTQELVSLIEKREELDDLSPSSYLGALAVYRQPIAETENITADDFKKFAAAKLLIVEDNLINQKILLGVLKNSGIDIDIANNGQEALDFLFVEKRPYDLVLMDISMPVMDGETASKKIREDKAFDDLPIVTFTAFALGEEIERMFDVGVNAYLTKPLNIKKLYTIFSVFLGNLNRVEDSGTQENESYCIEGLDIESGIKRADDNEKLYKETLKEFIHVYGDTVESIPTLIKSKQYEHVKVICREIQGVLTFIGAYEIKTAVDELQKQMIYGNDAKLEAKAENYAKRLKRLIGNIEVYIEN